MSRGMFLIFAAIVSVLYGLGLLFMPSTLADMHGIAGGPGTNLMARYFGAALVGLGLISWLVREADDSDVLTSYLRGSFVIAGVGLIVSLHAVFSGLMNGVGWVPVLVGVLLTLGFGIHGFARR